MNLNINQFAVNVKPNQQVYAILNSKNHQQAIKNCISEEKLRNCSPRKNHGFYSMSNFQE